MKPNLELILQLGYHSNDPNLKLLPIIRVAIMSSTNIPPTRQNLLYLKKRLKLAKNGHKLLKNKHDSLVKHLMDMISESLKLRKVFEQHFDGILENFNLARVTTDKQYLDVLMDTPSAEIKVDKQKKQILGVKFPSLSGEVIGDLRSYSLLSTNTFLDKSVDGLEEVLPLLLELGEKENAVQILLQEIDVLKRRINGLEHVVIPRTRDQIKFVKSKLEELALQEKVMMIQVKEKIMS